jgi:hypothetical protein
MRLGLRAILGFICFTFILEPKVQSSEIKLAPHFAQYKISMIYVRPGSAIQSVTGTMTYRLEESCDGWVSDNHSDLLILSRESDPVLFSNDMTSWESKNGLNYSFHSVDYVDKKITEQTTGKAHFKDLNLPGEALFKLPHPTKNILSAGTLFPVHYLQELLQQALREQKFMNVVLFDGSEENDSYKANTFIGHPQDFSTVNNETDLKSNAIDTSLYGEQYWPVQIAFFLSKGMDLTPKTEVKVHYFTNGVSDLIELNYDDYILRGVLEKLRPLPKSQC